MNIGYDVPELLLALEQMQEDDTYNVEMFEFSVDLGSYSRYSFYPLDAITFTHTGNNGISHAILTDFGRYSNLNDAPIVCLSPSNDPSTLLIASNIRDFLALLTTMENSTILNTNFESERELNQMMEDWFQDDESDPIYAEKRVAQAQLIRVELGLPIVDNVFKYLTKVKLARQRAVHMFNASFGNMGVYAHEGERIEVSDYTTNPKRLEAFLSQANLTSRRYFYRECTNMYNLSDDNQGDLIEVISNSLTKDELYHEANNLKLMNRNLR